MGFFSLPSKCQVAIYYQSSTKKWQHVQSPPAPDLVVVCAWQPAYPCAVLQGEVTACLRPCQHTDCSRETTEASQILFAAFSCLDSIKTLLGPGATTARSVTKCLDGPSCITLLFHPGVLSVHCTHLLCFLSKMPMARIGEIFQCGTAADYFLPGHAALV